MAEEDKQALLRRYAAGALSWHALQMEHGFDNYRQVLAGLGELGLRPPIAAMVGPNDGNLPHNNIQPYLTMNFCIALVDVYPSRS